MKNAHFIFDYIDDPNGYAEKAQMGVDLTVGKISKIMGGAVIKADPEKPVHGNTIEVIPYQQVWELVPGTYSIEFDQGLKPLPNNCSAMIIERSSVGRNGSWIRSSLYDPGFTTPKMGARLYVEEPISIELHARVAQITFLDGDESDLYNGQYQDKKDFR